MYKTLKQTLTLSLAAFFAAIPAQAFEVGASIGYLFDSEELFYAASFTSEFAADENFSHSWQTEIGYTQSSETFSGYSATGWILPVFFNYRFSSQPVNNTSFYLGGGVGGATVSVSGSGFGQSASDSDWVVAAQAFGGIEYQYDENASIRIGARYINLANPELFGVKVSGMDDFGLEFGFQFKF